MTVFISHLTNTTHKAPLNRLCPCYGAMEIVEVITIIITII